VSGGEKGGGGEGVEFSCRCDAENSVDSDYSKISIDRQITPTVRSVLTDGD
jgi:hypothetical protein